MMMMMIVVVVIIRCAERAQTPPRPLHCRGEASWRPLTSENISSQAASRHVNGSRNVIVDPHQDLDQHQSLITSTALPDAHAYHVWSTSVNALVTELSCSQTDRQTDRTNDRITPPWLGSK